jgi:Kef-type K+ transport system membrane component KefB
MTEPTTAGGLALIKIFGGAAAAAAAASALGFLLMWPKTVHEAFVRIVCTIISSTFFGPAMVVALHTAYPSLFRSAKVVATETGADPMLGLLFVAAPVMVMAGLPAWWVIGALVRWLERHRDADLGELIADAKAIFKTSATKKRGK